LYSPTVYILDIQPAALLSISLIFSQQPYCLYPWYSASSPTVYILDIQPTALLSLTLPNHCSWPFLARRFTKCYW